MLKVIVAIFTGQVVFNRKQQLAPTICSRITLSQQVTCVCAIVKQTGGAAIGVKATDCGKPFNRKLAVDNAAKSLHIFSPIVAVSEISTLKSSRMVFEGNKLYVPYFTDILELAVPLHTGAMQPPVVIPNGGKHMFSPGEYNNDGVVVPDGKMEVECTPK